jgi:hypothetical protein
MLTIPMPTERLRIDKFELLFGPFSNLVAVMFVLPVYNMVFFIVKEKEHRAKESMRMMALSDTSYWLSWLLYYSLQVTVISFLAWFTL